jgi:DNA-binding transcriptional LysR family regulator
MSEGKTGKIKMGYVGSAMQSIIPDLLVKFNSEFPDIKFGLMQLDNAQQIDSLLDHELDVGFVRLNQVPKNLKIKPIWKETFSIVLPKKHPLTQRKFKSISQLQNDPFILFEKEYSPVYYERVMSIFEDAGFSPNISHTSVHAQTIFRLVENNFGFSIVPTSLKSGFDMEVKFIELKNISQKATLFLTWNSSNRNPCLEKFLKMVD